MEPARLLCPWGFPGENTGVGCHFPLQGIFPTQWLNPSLLHWQVDSLPLSHRGSPTERISYTKNRLAIRAATPMAAIPTSWALESLARHMEEAEEQQQLPPDVAALSTPWCLRHEVCFWAPQVGTGKTLPPDTATFPPRMLGKATTVLKSLPDHCQELSNTDGSTAVSGRAIPSCGWRKKLCHWESWIGSL